MLVLSTQPPLHLIDQIPLSRLMWPKLKQQGLTEMRKQIQITSPPGRTQ